MYAAGPDVMKFMSATKVFVDGGPVEQTDGGEEDENVKYCILRQPPKNDLRFILVSGLHPSPASYLINGQRSRVKLAFHVYTAAVKNPRAIRTNLEASLHTEQEAKLENIRYIRSIMGIETASFFRRRLSIQYCPRDVLLELTYETVNQACGVLGFKSLQYHRFDVAARMASGYEMNHVSRVTNKFKEVITEVLILSKRLQHIPEKSEEPLLWVLTLPQEISVLGNLIALSADPNDTIAVFFETGRLFNPQTHKELMTDLTIPSRSRLRRKGIDFSNLEVASDIDLDETEQLERHETIFARTAHAIRSVFPDSQTVDASVLRLITCPAFSRFIGKYNIADDWSRSRWSFRRLRCQIYWFC